MISKQKHVIENYPGVSGRSRKTLMHVKNNKK